MKAYRKPSGIYIELSDGTPVSVLLVEVAPRPSELHTFSDTWGTDPLNPDVCWRLKTDQELNAEKDVRASSALTKTDQKFLLDVLYLFDRRIRKLEAAPSINETQFVNGPGGLLDIYKRLL